MPRFPFENGALNDLVVHDRVLDLAEQLLGQDSDDLRMYQAMLSAKYFRWSLHRRPTPARGFRQSHARRAAT